jgi:hypothetical protein
MAAYQSQYAQQQQQPAHTQQEQTQAQPQQGYAGFRGFDQYGSLPQPTPQQLQPQQAQQEQAPAPSQSPYEPFGAAAGGNAFGGSHLFGQGAGQHQGNEFAQRVSSFWERFDDENSLS